MIWKKKVWFESALISPSRRRLSNRVGRDISLVFLSLQMLALLLLYYKELLLLLLLMVMLLVVEMHLFLWRRGTSGSSWHSFNISAVAIEWTYHLWLLILKMVMNRALDRGGRWGISTGATCSQSHSWRCWFMLSCCVLLLEHEQLYFLEKVSKSFLVLFSLNLKSFDGARESLHLAIEMEKLLVFT